MAAGALSAAAAAAAAMAFPIRVALRCVRTEDQTRIGQLANVNNEACTVGINKGEEEHNKCMKTNKQRVRIRVSESEWVGERAKERERDGLALEFSGELTQVNFT